MTTEAPARSSGPILLVEDDVETRETMADILNDEGYSVYSAANGVEALELLSQMPEPSVILLDLMMPRMNGWEFLEAIEATQVAAGVPVVILSAWKAPAGFPCLQKPVDLGALLAIVARYSGA